MWDFDNVNVTPIQSTEGGYIALSGGADYVCALEPSGRVVCWGGRHDNNNNPTSPTVTELVQSTEGGYIALAMGRNHACGLEPSGAVVCWGGRNITPPVSAEGGFIDIYSWQSGVCGLEPSGSVVCDDNNSNVVSAVVTDGGPYRAIHAGSTSFMLCGIKLNGELVCTPPSNNDLPTPTSCN